MKMTLTAGALTAALLLAVISAVQAKEAEPLKRPTSTPLILIGE